MAEILSLVSPKSYIARTSVHDIKHIMATKRAIREAFQTQMDGRGFGLVEVLATCPTQWKLAPVRSMKRIYQEVIPYYPLGIFSPGQKEG